MRAAAGPAGGEERVTAEVVGDRRGVGGRVIHPSALLPRRGPEPGPGEERQGDPPNSGRVVERREGDRRARAPVMEDQERPLGVALDHQLERATVGDGHAVPPFGHGGELLTP
jgi:hypothetical protein